MNKKNTPRYKDAVMYDLMDQITEPIEKNTAAIVSRTSDVEFPNATDSRYDYLMKIPIFGVAETEEKIQQIIDRMREILETTLNATRCVVDFSDIVFSTTFESLADSMTDIIYTPADSPALFGSRIDQFVANVAVKLDLSSPKQLMTMLAKLTNNLWRVVRGNIGVTMMDMATTDTSWMAIGFVTKLDNSQWEPFVTMEDMMNLD